MRTAYAALTLLMIASCGDATAADAHCREVRGGGELIQKCGSAPPGYDAGDPLHDAGADDDAGADSRE